MKAYLSLISIEFEHNIALLLLSFSKTLDCRESYHNEQENNANLRSFQYVNPYFDSLSPLAEDMSDYPLFHPSETVVDPSEFIGLEPKPSIPYWDEDHMVRFESLTGKYEKIITKLF